MDISLTFEETRVLGSLIEKEKTTPDQYPISLNALTNACNQKTNRDPIASFDDTQVQNILDDLARKHLVSEDGSFGSRVTKYKHRFANSNLGGLQLTDQEMAIITVLFLRGAQTAGELRSRTNRLCRFENVTEVESVLQILCGRSDGPFVRHLARAPGKRERRHVHLFSGDQPDVEIEQPPSEPMPVDSILIKTLEARIEELETRVERLEILAHSVNS